MGQRYNCVLCGYVSRKPFCFACMDKAREDFEVICEFIEGHPKPTVIDVYNSTEIPLKIINGFLDMGWLTLVNEEVKVQKV